MTSVYHVDHITSAGNRVLLATKTRLWLVTVTSPSGNAAATMTLNLDIDLAKAGDVMKLLGGAKLRSLMLWVAPDDIPYALLGSSVNGRMLLLPLDVEQGNTTSIKVKRYIEMHTPMRKSDTTAYVADMAVWRKPNGATSLVTVGSDGNIAVAELHDGKEEFAKEEPDDSWRCTMRGSGGSKGYPYAPAFNINVHSERGVAFTGGQCEPFGFFWDLNSTKSSPQGRLLTKTPRFASGNPNKVHLMVSVFSKSGLLTFSNSNNDEDHVLKIFRPSGKT